MAASHAKAGEYRQAAAFATRAIEAARGQRLPELADPLGALRVEPSASERVAVRHGDLLLEPEGQLLLDFALAPGDERPVVSLDAVAKESEPVPGPDDASACFELGCRLDVDPRTYKEAIVAYWLEAMTRFEWVVQTAPHSVFDVADGADAGTGRVLAQETFKRADGVMGGLIAIYHDRYVRTGDGWRFAARKLEIRHFE